MSTYGRFWTNVLDSFLHHYHQNIKWGKMFWKNNVHPSSRVQRCLESVPLVQWSCYGYSLRPNTLLRHWMSVFPLTVICLCIDVFVVLDWIAWGSTDTGAYINLHHSSYISTGSETWISLSALLSCLYLNLCFLCRVWQPPWLDKSSQSWLPLLDKL